MSDDGLLRTAELAADGEDLDSLSPTSLISPGEAPLADELAVVARISRAFRRLGLEQGPGDVPPRKVGERWGSLELREVVGRGAYGTVFRAWDPTLEREVALKLFGRRVDPARVIDEGRKLARVRHPNVVSVYGADVVDGGAGIWMEFIRGHRLDEVVGDHGPMPAVEAARIGVELAGALSAVHAAGLIHGDVKAQNVMRDEGGRIVLMDMGASLATGPTAVPSPGGALVGTPAYMAPELFAREPASRASDVYSLGVLLFYLVSARFPITARTLEDLQRAHKAGAVNSLRDIRADLPAAYGAVVARMTAPDAAARYADTGELSRDLGAVSGATRRSRFGPAAWLGLGLAAAAIVGTMWVTLWRGAPAAPAVRTVAVLPIRNLSGDPSLDYIAEGLTEVLIIDLGHLRALRVPSYTAVAKYGDPALATASTASALRVDLLLTGSVTITGDRVRVTAQLIDPTKDQPIWAEAFTRDRAQALSTEAEVARLVAAHLALTLAPEEARALRQQTVSAAAQDAFLRGLVEMNAVSEARQRGAAAWFKQATELEPAFAQAFAYQALVLLKVADSSSMAVRAALIDRIRESAVRAVELDPGASGGYLALAALQFYYDWDFPAADASFRKAVELSPSDAFARQRYAMFLAAMRRLPEALSQAEMARTLEPLVPGRQSSYAFIYYYARDYERAAAEVQKALAIEPPYATDHFAMGRIASAMGDQPRAIREINAALDVSRNGVWLIELARVYTAAHQPADATRILQEIEELRSRDAFGSSVDSYAYIAAAAGRIDEAFARLDDAVANRVTNILWMAVDPRADPLRNDPRFGDLLRRIGL